MYSLDINFLNDRQERPTVEARPKSAQAQQSPIALYIGAIVGVGALALAGGYYFFAQYQTSALQQRLTELDGEIAAIEALRGEFEDVDSQVEAIESEVNALATVFDRIKPWSAIFQDVRGRIPNNAEASPPEVVQVSRIAQEEEEGATRARRSSAPAAEGEEAVAPPPPQPLVRIEGYATTFTAVNNFVLLLQRSPFLQPDDTRIVSAVLVDDPRTIEPVNEDIELEVELPQQVQYVIQARFTERTASELLEELQETSPGLAYRIETLRERGVLQP
jgi:type IV pilus assembly protein PilN